MAPAMETCAHVSAIRGGDRFKREIAIALKRLVSPLPGGRPRKNVADAMKQTKLRWPLFPLFEY